MTNKDYIELITKECTGSYIEVTKPYTTGLGITIAGIQKLAGILAKMDDIEAFEKKLRTAAGHGQDYVSIKKVLKIFKERGK